MHESTPSTTNDQAVSDSQLWKIAKACNLVIKTSEAMLPTPFRRFKQLVIRKRTRQIKPIGRGRANMVKVKFQLLSKDKL